MNVACDYEAPMQMLTTEKYIASRLWRTDKHAPGSSLSGLYLFLMDQFSRPVL